MKEGNIRGQVKGSLTKQTSTKPTGSPPSPNKYHNLIPARLTNIFKNGLYVPVLMRNVLREGEILHDLLLYYIVRYEEQKRQIETYKQELRNLNRVVYTRGRRIRNLTNETLDIEWVAWTKFKEKYLLVGKPYLTNIGMIYVDADLKMFYCDSRGNKLAEVGSDMPILVLKGIDL